MKKTNGLSRLQKTVSIGLTATALLAVGCSKVDQVMNKKQESKSSNLVVAEEGKETNQQIGDEQVQMKVMSASVVKSRLASGKLLAPNNAKALKLFGEKRIKNAKNAESIADDEAPVPSEEASLLVAMPIGLIGEQNMFGGVITKVSDKEDESLGGLKLTDLTPLHVQTFVTGVAQNEPAITLFGCASKCTESSAQSALLSFPIVGIDNETNQVILDLSPIGKELDLLSMMDPDGEYTGLKAIASATTAFDYSVSTLVFDIKTTFIAKDADPADETAKKTEFTVRWYLKLNSGSNPAYEYRLPTQEVGFFQTERSATSKIMRFSTTSPGTSAPVQYYIKNVPVEYRKAFSAAFDSWNTKFKPMLGKNLIAYEYVEATDPRHAELVPGDIRYNILEWDLVNKAGYGGLGPSIANQHTGETMSANVMIQGPTIVSLYTEWFKVNAQMQELEAQGQEVAAHKLLVNFNKKVAKLVESRKQAKFSIKLGKKLAFNVRTQRPDLEDPMTKGTFEKVPAGYDYAKYMHGYFLEMVAHELGHNLGLRHNFRGNLGSDNSGKPGSVSRSIMEYLGREYRHINTIQAYDTMAISYGYKGVKPTKKDWFCTDDHVAYEDSEVADMSAECSKGDATADPFSYFEARLARGVDMLVNRKSTAAPVWKVAEMSQVADAIGGLASYAASAAKTGDSWTNFFGKEGRPATKDTVKTYVLERIKAQLCDKTLADVVGAKESEEAKKAVLANLKDLKSAVAAKAESLNLYTIEDLSCAE